MSEKKTISINPDLFSFSSKSGTRKRQAKTDENGIKVKPPSQKKREDSLKKRSVLKMIRQRQEELYKDMFDKKNDRTSNGLDENDSFNKDFNEAQMFLQNLTQKKEEERKKRNMTIRQYPNTTTNSLLYHPMVNDMITDENISLELPPSLSHSTDPLRIQNPLILPPPQYGCLKRGNLPTYRSYINQTRKQQPAPAQPFVQNTLTPLQGSTEYGGNYNRANENIGGGQEQNRENKINEGLKRISEMKQTELKLKQLKNFDKPMIKKQRRIRRRTYKIGKSKVFPRVSVLVSNKTIRNNVSTQSQLLKQVPIQDVKKYLMKRGLIKIGSTAPNDVLRKMYESAIMICGEVQNHNPDNLLHNFIYGEEK